MVRAPRRPRLLRGGEIDFKLRRHVAWVQRIGKLRGASKHSRPKLFAGPERIYGRKSVIKASYVRNFKGRQWRAGLMQAHARYLERDGHESGHKEYGFDRDHDRVDIALTARNWALAKDKISWRLILSPEDHERVDLAEHTRKVLACMEQDLGTPLEWVAIQHRNTPHQHVHVFMRGVRQEYDADGRCLPLRMERDYVSYGIREISERLIEQELGPRTERQYLEVRSHGIEAVRWTEIDRAIERKAQYGIADYGHFDWMTNERVRERVQQEVERLAFLEGMGLAERRREYSWELRPDWKNQLLDLQREGDVIKNRARIRSEERERERAMEREI
jgi:type IV secretory pathway VirD2 relaxase